MNALGEVPPPLPTLARGDRDLAARLHALEQLHHVLVVGPPRRAPRHLAGVRQVARRGRALRAQQGEDVAAAPVVRDDPVGEVLLPLLQRRLTGPRVHVGAVKRDVLAGQQHRAQLDEGAVADQRLEVLRVVPAPEAGPEREVGVLRDHAGEVDLEEAQVPHHLQHVGGPRRVEQLGAYGDAPSLSRRQLEARRGAHARDPRTGAWRVGVTPAWPERVIPAPDRACPHGFTPSVRHAVRTSTSQGKRASCPISSTLQVGAGSCGTQSRQARCTSRTTYRAPVAATVRTATCRAPTAAAARTGATACSATPEGVLPAGSALAHRAVLGPSPDPSAHLGHDALARRRVAVLV